MQDVFEQVAAEVRARVEAANAANAASVKGTEFAPSEISKGAIAKFVREALEKHKDALVEWAVGEVAAQV